MSEGKPIVIKADVLFDGKKRDEDKYIVIEDDIITEITDRHLKADYEGIVTPGFIDAHSHIGMEREGEPHQEGEANDNLNQILPQNDPLDSIYFDDRAFQDAVDFGVLYSCVVPGSGNIIGGKAKIIRIFSKYRNGAVLKDYGYKMALGYNPRSTTDWKGDRPNTRMGVNSMLESTFDEVIQKKKRAEIVREKSLYELNEKKSKDEVSQSGFEFETQMINREYENEFSAFDNEILNMLSGDKTIKVHAHKEDDLIYLVELASKYKLKVTADHACDVFNREIFDMLADNNIPVVYGPLGSLGYKVELKNSDYRNTKLLMDSNAFYGLMSDHPVILSTSLRDSLKYFLMFGMSEEDAVGLITYRNAKILGIDDKLGTVEEGRLASLVVWNRNPFNLGARPILVTGEGKVLRSSSGRV